VPFPPACNPVFGACFERVLFAKAATCATYTFLKRGARNFFVGCFLYEKKPDRSANWFSPGNYRFLVQAFSYPPSAVKPGDEKTAFTETTG
jgi:ssDNA-binding Zn-finger/Zn-ribbon topoisomerase 1